MPYSLCYLILFTSKKMLFDFAVDALVVIMEKANQNSFVKGVLAENLSYGVNILKYVDAIFLIQDDVDSVWNLKFILCSFEQMFGFTINFF